MGNNGSLNANWAVPQWMPQFDRGGETKTLVVLDDVWSLPVLKQLLFRIPGVKFIVVTRFQFPETFDATYDVQLLNEEDALSLFCHHAFGQKSIPLATNQNLVKQVMV